MATTISTPKPASVDPLAAARTATSLPPATAGVSLLDQQRKIDALEKALATSNSNMEKILAAMNAQNSDPKTTVASKTVLSKSKGKVTATSGDADIRAEIARLTAENEALRNAKTPQGTLSCKVSDKGAVSVYGLGHWPVTLYREQWERLNHFMPDVLAFIAANGSKLKTK